MLWRAIRASVRLTPLADHTASIRKADVLLFAAIRNEIGRLPEFLAHYRKLGIRQFLIVDNDSSDGSTEFLLEQPDVSLWRTRESYRDSRFGMDWVCALLLRHGHDRWCLTVDADELLIYPDWDTWTLPQLTASLDARHIRGMGALMLDLYPRHKLGQTDAPEDAPLTRRLPWFDAGPYRCEISYPRRNRIVRGGVRERVFFSNQRDASPTLNKIPLVRWHWRYVYVNSTHSLFPVRLNDLYDGPGDKRTSGILLHSKFLPEIIRKSEEELARRQHFVDPEQYVEYHQILATGPCWWNEESTRFAGWQQLVALGLMSSGNNGPPMHT